MSAGTATASSLCLPFPLRPDYEAQIIIPRDLKATEAERLCAFIKTLAQPEPPIIPAANQEPQP